MKNNKSNTSAEGAYQLSAEQIQHYKNQGYLVIENVLTEAEMAEIDPWFDHFIEGKHEGMGRDLCDMSQPKDTPFEQYRLVNAMLPSRYEPTLDKSRFEQVAKSISEQLYGDLGYWPKTESTWTATFSLALSDSDVETTARLSSFKPKSYKGLVATTLPKNGQLFEQT